MCCKLSTKKVGWVLSIMFSLGYTIDFLWALTQKGDLQILYVNLLKIIYLKFSGLNLLSYILGLVQSFIWGWITAAVFVWLWHKINPVGPSSEKAPEEQPPSSPTTH